MSRPRLPGPVQVHMTFGQPVRDLRGVAATLSALDELWVGCYDIAHVTVQRPIPIAAATSVVRRVSGPWPFIVVPIQPPLRTDVERLDNVEISLHSPLIVELGGFPIWETTFGAGVLGLFRYGLKHPEEFVSWVPRAVSAWREQWARADRAWTDREEARGDREQFKELQDAAAESAVQRATAASEQVAKAELLEAEVTGLPEDPQWEPPYRS